MGLFAPLTRKPKQLIDPPRVTHLDDRDAGDGVRRATPESAAMAGSVPLTGTTEDTGDVAVAPGPVAVADTQAAEMFALARQLVAAIQRPRVRHRRSGVERRQDAWWSGCSDEIVLEKTLETLAERPVPMDDDITVVERYRPTRTVALVADVSGSMAGDRLRNAVTRVAALSAALPGDRLGITAFASDAFVIRRVGEHLDALSVLRRLIALPGEGLTNVDHGLDVAARELGGVSAAQSRIVLLSDCLHNAGPDPRSRALGGPRVDVLLDATGQHDGPLARDIARAGRGRALPVAGPRDVIAAVRTLFEADG